MQNYPTEDEAVIVEALSKLPIDRVWKEWVESCESVYERIYWRDIFFNTIIWFSPLILESMPLPIMFRKQVEEWIETI